MVTLDTIKQLAAQGDEHTLSIYLDVDRAKPENQMAQPGWRISLKHALSDCEKQIPDHTLRLQITERVNRFFDSYQVQTKGLAAFFTPDAQQIYELPVAVESRWFFGKPLIAPLLWSIDEYEPYLVVMVDLEKAELMTVDLSNMTIENRLESNLYASLVEERKLVAAPIPAVEGARGLTQGSRRGAVQNMVNEHVSHFYSEVVDQVEALVKQHPHIRIVICGEEQSAHAVHKLLPEHLTEAVVAVMPMSMHWSEQEVLQQILPQALDYEREQEMKQVQQVIDFAKEGGRGALGHKAVDQALAMQQVERLLIAWPADDEAEATEFSARAFEMGGAVERVHGAAADRLRKEGGIAAKLYYVE